MAGWRPSRCFDKSSWWCKCHAFPCRLLGQNTCRPKFSDLLFEILTSIQTKLTTSSVSKLEIGRGIFAPEVPIISNQPKMWLGLGRFVLKDPFFCKCLVLSNHPPKANLRLPCCMECFYDAFYKARCRCWMLPGYERDYVAKTCFWNHFCHCKF